METLDIMCDLETLGNKNTPVITQISAVAFDMITGKIYGQFDTKVSPQSSVKAGLKCDGDTMDWWLTQDQSVIEQVLVKSLLSGKDLKETLVAFNKFIVDLKKEHKVKTVVVWGNGVLADNKWLLSAYDAVGVTPEWKYCDDRDVRTLVDLGKRILNIDPKKTIQFKGEKHNAIDDCLHQIEYCVEIYKALTPSK